ncbi:hypothetical protein KFL_004670100 [Klebsormidium nitens]|uniref:Selenoprotein O n=1 Tax=Klebsormidium nitens TaxID=105231 RepID=A0A0U9HMB9_KLENI|nr:hypothetical protein KFL_004670100 [Klebsormidium nitens]|eukprot:GAQ88893.1 hypothetical protein KFL_004670100 [Klebsormidium nitens]
MSPHEFEQGGAPKPLLKLEELAWDTTFVRELPGDEQRDGGSRQVHHAFFSYVAPSVKISKPHMIAYSADVAENILGLDPAELERVDAPYIFVGAERLDGWTTYAQNYGGHQFGTWAGQLGDGRAVTLGEVLTPQGERWELQLKGAGRTPYSRSADGQAVLRSSLREFLCSEAMHGLGVPTTRALTLVGTGTGVHRDMFYDGHPNLEPGAVVCRMAPSFVRFGTFQLPAERGGKETKLVKFLADYMIEHHFPKLKTGLENRRGQVAEAEMSGIDGEEGVSGKYNEYAALFKEVAERTGRLVAYWQAVGFVHGVLNTDNMSILGLTLDYGPFAFLDAYSDQFTPNTSDPTGRYAFGIQPDVVLWNMVQLANAFFAGGLLTAAEARALMAVFPQTFGVEYSHRMAAKLGMATFDGDFTTALLALMKRDKVDFTNLFRALSGVTTEGPGEEGTEEGLLRSVEGVLPEGSVKGDWAQWMRIYIVKLKKQGTPDAERKAAIDRVNPRYVLRNYMLQNAIDAAEKGDFGEVRTLLRLVRTPYEDQPGMERYAALPPTWATKRGVCQLSCSS